MAPGGTSPVAAATSRLKRLAAKVAVVPVAEAGYLAYRRTDSTPRLAYAAMRRTFAVAPRAFERLARRAARESTERFGEHAAPGILSGSIDEALVALRRDGYHVLDELLPAAECDDLAHTARRAVCMLVGAQPGTPARAHFDPEHPLAARYEVDERDVLESGAAQRLVADQSVFELSRRYLGASPVQDLVTMWWSAAAGERGSSAAAQQFHFDLDRLRFVKLFVYLTDVDDHTGPHAFVKGSHTDLAPAFRAARRYGDDEVEPAYGDAVTYIKGPRGTMFLADTRALHKGVTLDRGHRLVFQLQYSSSLFGAPYTRPEIANAVPELQLAQSQCPRAYRRFSLTTG